MIPGLSSLGESLQSLISKNFVLSGLLPTVLFALASLWPISVIWPEYWSETSTQLEDLETIDSLLSFQLLALIVLSYVIWSFRAFFRELIEGRYLWQWARYRLIAFQSAYRRKLEEKRDGLRGERFSLRQVAVMDVFEARNVDPDSDDAATIKLSKKQWANELHDAIVNVRGNDTAQPAGTNNLASLKQQLRNLQASQAKQERIDFNELKICHEEILKYCTRGEYANISADGKTVLAEAAAELPHIAQYALAKNEAEYLRLTSLLAYRFPNDHLTIGPTALANMAEIQRSYAEVRYGINIDIIRPRLQKLIDEDTSFSGVLDATQTHVDTNIVMTVLSFVFGLVWFVPLAVKSDTPVEFAALVGASALATLMFYSLSVRAARRHGEVLRSAVDLFRFDLLDLLHIGKPVDSEEEVELWSRVMGQIALGTGYKIEYEHGDGDTLEELGADPTALLDDDGESRLESLVTDVRERVRDLLS